MDPNATIRRPKVEDFDRNPIVGYIVLVPELDPGASILCTQCAVDVHSQVKVAVRFSSNILDEGPVPCAECRRYIDAAYQDDNENTGGI